MNPMFSSRASLDYDDIDYDEYSDDQLLVQESSSNGVPLSSNNPLVSSFQGPATRRAPLVTTVTPTTGSSIADQCEMSNEESFQEHEDHEGEHSAINPSELSEEVDENTSAIFNDETSYDVESLTEKLNDVSNYLRKEIMSQYFDVKGKLHKKTQDQLRKVINEKEGIIAEREERIEKLIEGVKKRDFYLNKFKGLTFRMADLVAHVRHQEHLKTLRAECFMRWREYVHDKKRTATLSIIARKHYLRGIKRRILQGWYIWILQHKQSSSDAIWGLRLDTTVAELKNDYDIKMDQLRQQIEVLNSRLLHETKDKRVLQENLKKALMRGVCAMNNQFLDIIKGTTENPIPNLSEAEVEETMLRHLFENDQSNHSPQMGQANINEEDLMMPREPIPAATSAHIHQYVKEYQPPNQPYFPTQQPVPRQTSQFSNNSAMDASELRTSQQKVRVMRNAPVNRAVVSGGSPPRPNTAPNNRRSPPNGNNRSQTRRMTPTSSSVSITPNSRDKWRKF